ncbi:MAG: hypothetical protein WA080_07480 [Sulfuricurvum sp.]
MNHQELANQFNTFAYELVIKHTLIDHETTSLQNETFLRRIIFSRFYYALYHKYLAHDSTLSNSTASGKHETISQKIKNCKDDKLYQVFLKLKTLRVWADYSLNEVDANALKINLITLSQEVNSILKREKDKCA